MKWTKLEKSYPDKPIGTKVKAGFSWQNIGKVVDCEGDEYTLIPIGPDKVRMIGDGDDHTVPTRLALSVLNVYDKSGNLVNDMKDYE